MKRWVLPSATILLLVSFFLLTACTTKPSSGSIKINVLNLRASEITLSALKSAFSSNALNLPLYTQPSGTRLYAVVIPFDIMRLPTGVSYNSVSVMMRVVKDTGTGGYGPDKDANVIAAIPSSVDRTADTTTSTKLAAGFTAAISILSGNVTLDSSTSESYQKLYRTVTAHLTPANEINWDFDPFKDEPIQAGTYNVVAVIEVLGGTSGNLVYVSAGCSYAVSQWGGLSHENDLCYSGANQSLEIVAK